MWEGENVSWEWRKSLELKSAKYWIEKLKLEPHPEGGYFRQTYRVRDCDCAGGFAGGFYGGAGGVDGDLLFAGREELLGVSPLAVG